MVTPRTRPSTRELAAGEVPWVHVAPWYVTHKIMAGLRDAYAVVRRTAQARDVLVRMADWCIAVTARLTPDQWQAMLDREHGGPHEVLADVHGLTGEQEVSRTGPEVHSPPGL